MKHFFRAAAVIFLATLIALITPMQSFAKIKRTKHGSQMAEYISEVKVFYDNTDGADGYTILTDESGNPIDLNQGAGGGLGSKGEKAVYLGYKTTKDSKEAITDLAIMNMKGGYSVDDYEALMDSQMKSQIIPFIDNFIKAINEYRQNIKSGNAENKARADYVCELLNKFIDDDTGKGLGDLLQNETVYEMAVEKFSALSDDEQSKTDLVRINAEIRDSLPENEKKEHADILTILAQSNGKALLLVENLLTRAADNNDSTWLERFLKISQDDLVEATRLSPVDASKQLSKLYDDDAQKLLEMTVAFREELAGYEDMQKIVEEYDADAVEKAINDFSNLSENATADEISESLKACTEAKMKGSEYIRATQIIGIHDYFETLEYGEGSLLDFFMQDADVFNDDITLLYPLVAALTDGQKAGLDFISLRELCVIAVTDAQGYKESETEIMPETSIYEGVDRGIYEPGGVALTSDALRKDAMSKITQDKGMFSGITIGLMVLTAVSAVCMISSVVANRAFAFAENNLWQSLKNYRSGFMTLDEFTNKFPSIKNFASNANMYDGDLLYARYDVQTWSQKYSGLCHTGRAYSAFLSVGFTITMVLFAGITTALAWEEMKDYYKVDFTPIPKYMVDEKDITGFNSKGEKIVLKNQTAYYKAVECNRSENAEFYKVLGSSADMNGDVGRQWLALYAVKNEMMDPILASSLKVVVGDTTVPNDYSTGIHMFGSAAAFNLNSSLYDWNKDAKSVFVYFKTDDSATSTTGSNFSGGTLALAGGAGIAVGALVTAVATKCGKKKIKEEV